MFKRVQSGEKIKLQFSWLENYVYKKETTYPLTIEIDASNVCPLSCTHCVWRNMLNNNRDIMSEKILTSIIEQSSGLGVKGIVWTGGGEPLTNPHVVDTIRISKNLGIKNSMFTNGLLLKREKAEDLCEYLEWIRFNLGASNSSDYSAYYRVSETAFQTVCGNIRYYCGIVPDRLNVGIGTAINPSNFDFVKNVPYLSAELGAGYCQIKPDFFLINSQKYAEWWSDYVEPYFNSVSEELKSSIKVIVIPVAIPESNSNYCHAHHIITSVTADGRVNFCKMRRDEMETSIGNVKDMSLKEIFNGITHHELSTTINPKHCSGERFCPYVSMNNYVDDLTESAKNLQDAVFF